MLEKFTYLEVYSLLTSGESGVTGLKRLISIQDVGVETWGGGQAKSSPPVRFATVKR